MNVRGTYCYNRKLSYLRSENQFPLSFLQLKSLISVMVKWIYLCTIWLSYMVPLPLIRLQLEAEQAAFTVFFDIFYYKYCISTAFFHSILCCSDTYFNSHKNR